METLKNIGWTILGWITDLYLSIVLIIVILIGLPLGIVLSLIALPFTVLWDLFTGIQDVRSKIDKEE